MQRTRLKQILFGSLPVWVSKIKKADKAFFLEKSCLPKR